MLIAVKVIFSLIIASFMHFLVPSTSKLEAVFKFVYIAFGLFLMTMGFTAH